MRTRSCSRTAMALASAVAAIMMLMSPVVAAGHEASGPTSDPATTGCGPTWTTVPSVDVGPLGDRLSAVDAIDVDDAWAVGHSLHPPREGEEYGGLAALAEHWDGHRWSAMTVPDIAGAIGTSFEDVTSVAADDAWAVGRSEFLIGEYSTVSRPLIMHWDGRAWSAVPAPGIGPERNGSLTGIVAFAPDDAWAVGSFTPDLDQVEAVSPLLMHWQGSEWTIVAGDPAIEQYPSARLDAVSGAGSDELWAVGWATRDGIVAETLVQHWDGDTWRMVDSPSPRRATKKSFGSVLSDVMVRGPRDVIAVGRTGDAPYVIRWDGRRWGSIPTPVRESASLYGVDAVSDGRLVAVGDLIDGSTLDGRALAMDIDRRSTVVASEAVARSFQTSLFDVTTTSVPQWAVGSAVGPEEDGMVREHTLIQQRCPG